MACSLLVNDAPALCFHQQKRALRIISNSLCEKAFKEDSASTREAVSPRIETSLSTQKRSSDVFTSRSISNFFGFVKRITSNFSALLIYLEMSSTKSAYFLPTIYDKIS